jgi:hypothetical protein
MFTILQKRFGESIFPHSGDRISNRYFHSWDSAKSAMHKSIEDTLRVLNGEIIRKSDYMNTSKGFYVYEQTAKMEDGEYCTWALIDGYFEDEI